MTACALPRQLLIALPMLVVAGAALAQDGGRFVEPRAGEALESGDKVRLAWNLPDAQTQEFDEMEIVLSLDGGRTFPVRVTRDLIPGTRSMLFRVPALPSTRARLALRAGDGGEHDAESILLVSDEFAIVARDSPPLEPTASVRGEWRTREAFDSGQTQPPPDPRTLGAGGPSLRFVGEALDAAAPRPRPPAEGSAPRCAGTFDSAVTAGVPPPRPEWSRAPREIPRRE